MKPRNLTKIAFFCLAVTGWLSLLMCVFFAITKGGGLAGATLSAATFSVLLLFAGMILLELQEIRAELDQLRRRQK